MVLLAACRAVDALEWDSLYAGGVVGGIGGEDGLVTAVGEPCVDRVGRCQPVFVDERSCGEERLFIRFRTDWDPLQQVRDELGDGQRVLGGLRVVEVDQKFV
ncbi:hypothetical protein [Halobaculum gomorrense]|uniref:hypothetical protein n=1 Tax=Halobaculum gomorrense TaxID=43928 RepID=UPI001F21FC56|nr:hypothetical protein [Halobaculum gomorrense]